ncbi:MAG: hypothetical protein GY679_02345 [Mycoplasma sp.]|nr:hypothetical protein [Mycoplasma sp.]
MDKNKNSKKQTIKTGSWTTAIVTFIFILIPALMIIIFLSSDFNNDGSSVFNIGIEFAIAFSFILYSVLLVVFLWWIQLTWIDIANFIIPIAIVMMTIFLSHRLSTWVRALIVLPLILTTLPISIITNSLTERMDKNNYA